MAKKTVPPLPWEVVIYILTFVPPSHLLSVILACQALRKLAEPLLYRDLDLSNSPTRSLYLIRTLLSRKDLCRHVRTFQPADRHSKPDGYIEIFRKILRGETQEHMRRTAYIQHAERVAGKLTYVENISVHTSSELSLRALGNLSRVKKFRTLHPWGLRQHESLLDALPNVTHLELPFTSFFLPVSEIRPYHALQVEELICPTNVAVRLVPGRPVQRLFLLWPMLQGPPDSFELMKEMARSTETIKVLGLFVGWGWNWQGDMAQIVSATATFLPDVEELTLKMRCWRTNSHLLHLMLQQLPEDLASLHKLRVLDFNGSVGYGVDYFDHRRNAISAVYTRILQIWSERCPTLEKVVFPNGAIWVKESVVFLPHSTNSGDQMASLATSTTLRRRPRPLSNLTLPSFRRSPTSLPPPSPPSPQSPNDESITSIEEDKDVHARGSSLDDITYDEHHHLLPNNNSDDQDDLANTTRQEGSARAATPHFATTATTCKYRWRCVNPFMPRSNRTTHSFFSRIEGSERWSTPLFKRDLNRQWPEGLWNGSAP